MCSFPDDPVSVLTPLLDLRLINSVFSPYFNPFRFNHFQMQSGQYTNKTIKQKHIVELLIGFRFSVDENTNHFFLMRLDEQCSTHLTTKHQFQQMKTQFFEKPHQNIKLYWVVCIFLSTLHQSKYQQKQLFFNVHLDGLVRVTPFYSSCIHYTQISFIYNLENVRSVLAKQ